MSPADQARRENALLRLARLGGHSAGTTALAGEAGVLAFVALLLIVPVALAISSGFVENGQFTTYWFKQALGSPLYLEQLLNGLALASATTLVSLAIALPLAILRARCRFPGQGLLGLLLLLPLILPPFVGALAMRHLFGQFGSLNLLLASVGVLDFGRSLPPDWLGAGFAGVVVLQSLHLFPILYLNASAALANIDPAYAQAARNLGAGPLATFVRITLPLMRPGLFAGATIIFIWSFTDVGTPLIMGYNDVVPVTIFKELAKSETTPDVFSLVFLMLLVSASLYVAGKFLFGRSAEGQSTKASIAQEPHRLHGWSAAGAWLLHGAVIVAALLPHVGVVLTAVSAKWVNTIVPSEYTWRHLRFVFEREQTVRSVFNSLQYSSVSTAIDLAVGCAAAWLIVRSRVLGRNLLDTMTMLPLAVPGLILASGLVALTAAGPLEAIGPRANPFVILVAAYAIRRLPFVVRGVSAGLQQVSVSLEEAARNLGAGRARTALRITLPLVAANVVAAGVLTFAFAMLEVSDSLILAQVQKYYPITKEIYTQATSGNADAANLASALGVYSMLFLGGMLGLASLLMGKRLGAIFRA
ncbi:MAG: Molybdenum transport system permease protein ModB [Planctomycetes bacterium ADurb.Bin126]|nr:MAG: Molybdenum transport system permease protein ModB [Planctomycetes bacterium ADurb.Bin126]HOD80593.1 iron ABC transporter permease [Phycisphaerae bacterium]HQL75823.1 iron ABC transporter permease [Phycisphaerae bacterium]